MIDVFEIGLIMKKLVMVCVLLVSGHSWAHKFLDQILVHESPAFFVNPSNPNSGIHYKLGSIVDYEEINLKRDEIIHISHLYEQAEQKRGLIFGTGTTGFTPTHDGLDHFDTARFAAIITCDSKAFTKPMVYEHGAVPVFTGPETFVNVATGEVSDDHHSYHLNEGIRFYCRKLEVDPSY